MEASARRWATFVAFGLLFTLPRAASATGQCDLLNVEEIAQALGNPISPMPVGTTGCMWKGSPQYLSIVLRDASAWARITTRGPGITKTDVSGIGDAAQFSDSHGMPNFWTLSAKQGNNVIVLTVYGAKSPDQQRSSEESLARLALKHL
jgi:hypothetical protein